jgi:hypothetical protein
MATQIDPGYPDRMLPRIGSFVTFKRAPDRSLIFFREQLWASLTHRQSSSHCAAIMLIHPDSD